MVKLKSLRGVDGQKANCTRISGRLFRPQRYSLEKAPALRHSRGYSGPLAVISANSRARFAALRAAFLSS